MQYTKFTFYLLVALPTALASISLEDIESLKNIKFNTTEVSLGCIKQSHHEIDKCTVSELSSGSCNPDCISALKSFASGVILACRQDTPDDGTLLRMIDDNKLVDTLCTKTTKVGDSQRGATTTISTTTPTTSSAVESTFNGTVTSTLDAPATESTATETTSEPNTVSPTSARTSDDTMLGSSDSAILGARMGMGMVMAVAIAAVVAVL